MGSKKKNKKDKNKLSFVWQNIPVFSVLAKLLCADLVARNEYLTEENSIMRGKFPGRVPLDNDERKRLGKLGKKIGVKGLEGITSVAKPATVIGWYRKFVKMKWTFPNGLKGKKRPGRPQKDIEIQEMVLKLAKENNWGYAKVHGQCLQLGIDVSETTVRDILKRNGLELDPDHKGKSWSDFLKQQAEAILCVDFTTKEIFTFKGLVTAYVFVAMHLKSRAIVFCGATFEPGEGWLRQTTRNMLMSAEDLDIEVKYVIHDNCSMLCSDMDGVLKSSGIKPVKTAIQAPNMNPVERLIRSMKEECLSRVLIIGLERLQKITKIYSDYFNEYRAHQGIGQLTPLQVLRGQSLPPPREVDPDRVECIEFIGGLLKGYRLRPAA